MSPDPALDFIRREALWFERRGDGLLPLHDAIGSARVVLIGEASHGTHELYQIRAELTKLLIAERNFNLACPHRARTTSSRSSSICAAARPTHIRQQAGDVRAVVWAHNSHLGDARAT